ncbi:MAG: hypothetical protein V2I41_14810, partial [Pseudomonadales bacterium]|nr:hypothetical protein [Pseudomonadales bacterium]
MNKANISTGVFLYTAVLFIFLSGAHIDAAELTDEEVVQIILLIGGDGPPVVSAGNDAGAVAGTSVEIRADISGSATNSMWEQLTGPVVDISGSLFSVLRFDAPAVAVETELSFRLTADDGSGGTLQDDISVTIHPNAVPELSVAFPCDGCRAYGSHLSIRGWATPGADVDFVLAQESVAVQVNVGGEDLPAVVSDSGEWVLQDAPLPSGIGEVQITVTAEDAFGQSTIQELTLKLAPTLSGPRLAAHPLDDGKLVFLDQGFYERLSVYDVATELFTVVYENLGANVLSQVLDIEVDPDGSRVLFGESPTGRILEIDLTSGGLSAVSNVNVGAGPALQSIREIALNADDRELIVFDRTQQALFAVDLDSGDRVEIAAVTNTPFLAVDSTGDSAFVATQFEGFPIEYSNLLEVDLNTGEVSDRGSIELWAPNAVDYDPENDQLGLLAAFSNRV